ncbi:MAG: hypothetical protein IJ523_07250 [Succinivibrionaceae bacterium]|nr:hypothetical protein [Succinivibrionaceae bacterium]
MEKRNITREEEFEKKLQKIERIALIVLSGASVVTAVYCHSQMRKSVKLLNKAADSVSELTVVDVQQGIIDRAINNAANREVGRAVNRAMRMMEDGIASETQKRVRNAVQQSQGKLQKAVTDAIAKEAAKVDKDDIMEEATERAKEMLLERFDGKLDGLMSDYQRNLDNVGKIYQSIASSMADKAGKDVTLKLG